MSAVDASRRTNPPKGTAMYHNADSPRAHDSGIDAGLPLARAIAVLACALSVLVLALPGSLYAENPAPTPPMGWSEWDSYGLTITEADFRANAAVLASLRHYGWQYAMLDAGWYEDDPANAQRSGRHYQLDGNGQLIPAVNRFPSAADGEGFKRLADWLHTRGLKLGIHVMLGIPRQAVERDALLAGSAFRASEAADTTQTCPWDSEFYAVKDNAAGRAWYDSIAKQYANWGVDLIKLGCVSDRPYRSSEIRQISEAIRTTRRPMVLSLSPGPPPQEYASFVGKYAQMWRVSVEHWDVWTTPKSKSSFPIGLRDEFDILAKWAPLVKSGNWVDPDGLPNGWLGPHPAWGQARSSQLTHDEQRSEFTLWAFARAPLIEGANLTRLDPFTRELMTDRVLLDIDQNARESHPITDLPPEWNQVRIWEAQTLRSGRLRHSFAFFNLGDTPLHLHARWAELGLSSGTHIARDLRNRRQLAPSEQVEVVLPEHGSAVYCVQ
jgi:alpha-galactosidase